jgi:hypothetical protein
VHVATPVVPLTGWAEQAAIGASPSLNRTVPPAGAGDTVAVYVTASPARDGLTDDTNAVAVEIPDTWLITTRPLPDCTPELEVPNSADGLMWPLPPPPAPEGQAWLGWAPAPPPPP